MMKIMTIFLVKTSMEYVSNRAFVSLSATSPVVSPVNVFQKYISPLCGTEKNCGLQMSKNTFRSKNHRNKPFFKMFLKDSRFCEVDNSQKPRIRMV